MPLYLAASHLPEDFDPSTVTEAMIREIDVMNDELVAAGARIFGAGLYPASEAKTLRPQPDGKVLVTDGPFLETKEHVGGFIILKAANLDEALAWGRKFARRLSGRRSRCARSSREPRKTTNRSPGSEDEIRLPGLSRARQARQRVRE